MGCSAYLAPELMCLSVVVFVAFLWGICSGVLREAGNTSFRAGRFEEALGEYAAAIRMLEQAWAYPAQVMIWRHVFECHFQGVLYWDLRLVGSCVSPEFFFKNDLRSTCLCFTCSVVCKASLLMTELIPKEQMKDRAIF